MTAGGMDIELERCEESLAAHLGAVVRRFGAVALGVVSLPPLSSGTSVDPAQLRLCAAMLWAREVEDAGLPSFVESLAEGVVKGTLLLPLTTGADLLAEYYRGRQERFGESERRALYQRLFGNETDEEAGAFFPMFRALIAVLAQIGDAGLLDSVGRERARAAVVAREIAVGLAQRSGGIMAFAAREIAGHVRAALALLQSPDIALPFGVGGPWAIIRVHALEVLGRAVDPDPHLMRARAGFQLLAWVAEVGTIDAPSGNATVLGPGDPAVQAAQSWRAAGNA
jgi:hypothetical protein